MLTLMLLQGTQGLNTYYGIRAGENNTIGSSNSFFGTQTGQANDTGSNNTFFGYSAGYENRSGHSNSFFGMNAGYKSTGNWNSFFGNSTGEANTTGVSNSFFGQNAGNANKTGNDNSFFGTATGYKNETGVSNSFFGHSAGFENVAGNGNVFLGHNAGYWEKGDNKLYIDNSDTAYPLISGDFVTNDIIIYGGFKAIASYSSSDGRWKKNMKPLESSLEKVSHLQGMSYEWKTDEYPDFGLTEGKQIGLIAQDVEKELPELVSEDKDGYKAVSYTKLTAVLVEAVKELKAQSEKQQAEIERLRDLIKDSKS